jgi:hypothetical protein
MLTSKASLLRQTMAAIGMVCGECAMLCGCDGLARFRLFCQPTEHGQPRKDSSRDWRHRLYIYGARDEVGCRSWVSKFSSNMQTECVLLVLDEVHSAVESYRPAYQDVALNVACHWPNRPAVVGLTATASKLAEPPIVAMLERALPDAQNPVEAVCCHFSPTGRRAKISTVEVALHMRWRRRSTESSTTLVRRPSVVQGLKGKSMTFLLLLPQAASPGDVATLR